MNDSQQMYDFIDANAPPVHNLGGTGGFNPMYAHVTAGPSTLHPGTGILPIDEIPVFSGFDFPVDAELQTPIHARNTKPRRRRTTDGDHIKHRRTRNGCYTCRGRRIKCDESRPICERCKKGSRDCVYPDAPASIIKSKSLKEDYSKDDNREGRALQNAGHEDDSETIKEESPPLGTGPRSPRKENETQSSSTTDDRSIDTRQRKGPGTSKQVNFNESVGPGSPGSSQGTGVFTERSSDKSSESGSVSQSPGMIEEDDAYSHLIPELRELLRYFHAHIGYHHYFFRQDATQFLKDLLPNAAMGYEPLLYALCGFAAYHRAIAQDGKIEDFLGYYNKAVTLLLQALRTGEEHSESMLMCILQLATFEEYLGDWTSLRGHQAAAYQLIHELYTPETMVISETRRKTFAWFARFDLFVGMMSGRSTTLSIEWFRAQEKWHYEARRMDPTSVDLQVRWLVAYKRVLNMTYAALSSKLQNGEIPKEQFALEYGELMKQFKAWGQHLVPLMQLADETEPLGKLSDHSEQWVDGLPRTDKLFLGQSWGVNTLLVDLYSNWALQRMAFARFMGLPSAKAEADILVKEECRLIEAMDRSSYGPEGKILLFQAILSLLGMFVQEPEYKDWVRQKLAKLESVGYSYPPLYRNRLAEQWNDPSLRDWWVPSGEGYRSIIKSLRTFNQERDSIPRDRQGQDVKEIRGLFNDMVLGKQPGGPKDPRVKQEPE